MYTLYILISLTFIFHDILIMLAIVAITTWKDQSKIKCTIF